jgi:hypothetical protein
MARLGRLVLAAAEVACIFCEFADLHAPFVTYAARIRQSAGNGADRNARRLGDGDLVCVGFT